jgi:flagellar biosynthesis protein FlhB
MSEATLAQERTEQPTPKRLQKAREQGQVPRSRELNTMVVTLIGAGAMAAFGGWMMARLRGLLIAGLAGTAAGPLDARGALHALDGGVLEGLFLISPLLIALMLGAFAGPALLGGLGFSGEAVQLKFERLSPIEGFKRIFSMQGLTELLKTLLKFAVLSLGAVALLWWLAGDLLSLGRGAPLQRILDTGHLVETGFFVLASGLVLIAAVDVPYQLWTHRRRLRMTRQEVRDELKESEGSPEVRARVRRLQRQVAARRMMQDVPQADVVITNPTHFAVALRYTDRPERAPRVVAKGRGLVAARIREVAEQHAVPVCGAPPLARAIYFTTEIGAEVPAALYLGVARVLVWVMQLKAAREAGAVLPQPPTDLPVPDELVPPGRLDA